MITVSQLVGLVRIDNAEQSVAKLEGVGRATDSVGGKLLLLGAGVAAGVGAGLAVLGAKAVEMAGNFQQGVTRLRTGAGDVTDSFASLSASILKVSTDTGVLTGPLTQAMYLILSSGQRGAQAYNTLAVAAEGAQIEQAKVGDVANVLSGLMTNYGTKVFGATQYMNGLITAVKQGKITLQDLSTAMGPIDPIAKSVGVSFSDLAAAMTTQTNAMIPAQRAATGLRFMMLSLENPTKKAKDAMTAMGLNSIDVANEMKVSLPGALEMIYKAALKAGPENSPQFVRAFSDMVGGVRSFSTATALTGPHMADFIKNADLIAASMKTGSTAVTGWADVQKNFNEQMDKAKAGLEAFGIKIGTALMPYVQQFIGFLTSQGMPLLNRLTDWVIHTALPAFNQFSDWFITKAVPYIQGLAKTIGDNLLPPIKDLIGNVSGIAVAIGTWAVQSGFLATAVGTVSAVLGTLVGWIGDFVGGLRDSNPLASALAGLLGAIGTALGLIKLETFASGLKSSFDQLRGGAGLVANLTASAFPQFSQALGVTQAAVKSIGTEATAAAGTVKVAQVAMSASMAIATLGFSAAAGVLVTAFMLAKNDVTLDFTQLSAAGQKAYNALGTGIDDLAVKAKASSVVQQAAAIATTNEIRNQGSRASEAWANSYANTILASANSKAKQILDVQAVAKAAEQAAQRADAAWVTASQDMSLVALLAAAGWTGPQIAAYTGQGYNQFQSGTGGRGAGGGQAFDEGGPVLQTGLALVHKGEYVIPAGGWASGGGGSSSGGGSGGGYSGYQGPSTIVVQVSEHQLMRIVMPAFVNQIRSNLAVNNF